MSKLTKSDVSYVAKLSNLTLTDGEVDKFTTQLSSIVDFISELSEIDTTNVLPVSQTVNLTNVYRNDEIKVNSILTADEALSGTDEVHNGLIKVSAILSERTDK